MEASSSKLWLRLPYRLCLTLRGPHAGQQADRQQDELLLQLTDAVIIGESRYRVTVGSSTLFESPGPILVLPVRALRRGGAIEPGMHVLARLERQQGFLRHYHSLATARVSCAARRPFLRSEHPEAAQFDPVTTREPSRDRVEYGVDNGLSVPPVQVRVLLGDPRNQF